MTATSNPEAPTATAPAGTAPGTLSNGTTGTDTADATANAAQSRAAAKGSAGQCAGGQPGDAVFERDLQRVYPAAPPDLPPLFAVPRTQALAKQSHEIVVPSHAAWFAFDKIHNVERKALPEFFNYLHPSRTPDIYLIHRNFMVNSFRSNPLEYLPITACRRNLVGDVASIIRVHAFLEQWGLINYQIEPDTRPSQVGPTFHGHFRITAHTPVSQFKPTPDGTFPPAKLLPSTKLQANIPAPSSSPIKPTPTNALPLPTPPQPSSKTPSSPLPPKKQDAVSRLRTRLTTFQDQRLQRYRRAPPTTCSSCGVLCGRSAQLAKESTASVNTPVSATSASKPAPPPPRQTPSDTRWHCLKNVGLDVCGGCFSDGRFPSAFLSCDFVQLGQGCAPEDLALRKLNDPRTGNTDATDLEEDEDEFVDLGDLYDSETEADAKVRLPWTLEETFLLAEGVEHFDEDWGKVAFHIGTRSKEECMERFLGMSVEEPYLVEGGGAGVLAYRGAAEMLNRAEDGEEAGGGKAGSKRKWNALKPVWPVSVLEALPVTPAEDPGMALAALLASVVDPGLAKMVAEAGIKAHEVAQHPVRKTSHTGVTAHVGPPPPSGATNHTVSGQHMHTSPTAPSFHAAGQHAFPTKSPKANHSTLHPLLPPGFGLELRRAELELKKLNLLLTRHERIASHVEHERCQVEVERRGNVVEGIAVASERREMRKKQKLGGAGEDGVGVGNGAGGVEEVKVSFGGVDTMENSEQVQSEDEDERESERSESEEEGEEEEDELDEVGTPPDGVGSNESNMSGVMNDDGDDIDITHEDEDDMDMD
ncbi:hypothetical protein HDU98_007228 [Podochytrium sp. JEL0797]|nr:hypothetical protein HDU98_007228 [Podochytrium sp. JEL0797]